MNHQPAHSPIVERDLLSWLIRQPDWFDRATEVFPLSQFRYPATRIIYQAMHVLREDQKNKGQAPYFTDHDMRRTARPVAEGGLGAEDLDHLLVTDAEVTYTSIFKEASPPSGVDRLMPIGQIVQEMKPVPSPQNRRDLVMLKSRIAYKHPEITDLYSVPCPQFPRLTTMLDYHYPGFARGGVTMLAARAKTGKTTFMQNVGLVTALSSHIPVCYLDTEMGEEQMTRRNWAAISGVDEGRLKNGSWQNDPLLKQECEAKWALLKSNPWFQYHYIKGWGPPQIIDVVEKFAASLKTRTFEDLGDGPFTQNQAGLVIYDYMQVTGGDGRTSEWQMLDALMRDLTTVAQKTDLPLLVGAQLNRAGINMSLADFVAEAEKAMAGSDRILWNAHAIVMLRNLTATDLASIGDKMARRPECLNDPDSLNAYQFNQTMHVMYNRSGGIYREGIPLHLRRGWAVYTEVPARDSLCDSLIRELAHPRATAAAKGGSKPRSLSNLTTPPPAQF